MKGSVLKIYKIKKRILKFKKSIKSIKKKLILIKLKYWRCYNNTIFYLKSFLIKHASLFQALLLIILCFSFHIFLSTKISNYINNPETISNILIPIGCSLIGLSILSFSLVMVAMQITVDKLPNELFRRFNNDYKLKSYFLLMFTISISITILSTFINSQNISSIISIFWGLIVLMLYIIFSTYKRASQLINPELQTQMLISDIIRYTKQIKKHYKRIEALLNQTINPKDLGVFEDFEQFDVAKAYYINTNPYIFTIYFRYVDYLISISSIYSKTADYKISANALNKIIDINCQYISFKEGTFFNDDILLDNPLATDKLINHTLETLRIELNVAFLNKDEIQIENILNTLGNLVNLYSAIKYVNNVFKQCKHAQLACVYLINGIKKSSEYGFTDIVMKSLKNCETIFATIILNINHNEIIPCINELTTITQDSLTEKSYPCVSALISLLSSIQMRAFLSDKSNKRIFFENIIKSIHSISLQTLQLEDDIFFQKQKTILAPYFSTNTLNNFLNFFINLTNKVCKEPTTKENKLIIHSIYEWCLSQPHDINILERAIESKSLIAYDIAYWYTQISCCLIQLISCTESDAYTDTRLRTGLNIFISKIITLAFKNEYINELHQSNFHHNVLTIAAQAHNYKMLNSYDKVLMENLLKIIKACIDKNIQHYIISDFLMVLITIIVMNNGNNMDILQSFILKNKDSLINNSNFDIQVCLRDIFYASRGGVDCEIYVNKVLSSLNKDVTSSVVFNIASLLNVDIPPFTNNIF